VFALAPPHAPAQPQMAAVEGEQEGEGWRHRCCFLHGKLGFYTFVSAVCATPFPVLTRWSLQ